MSKVKYYDHRSIEKKWQTKWEKVKLYSPDIQNAKNPFYNLWMFPYPSAEGLHAGHAFASTGSDIYGRFMRMNGKTVFQPIGYDSFGIHSENYAIKINQKPQDVVKRTTKHYGEQMRALGHGYDWTRTVTTSDPGYYKWTQWLFIKMYEHGLAYKKKASVNFCPSCKTVLADEQVMTPRQAGRKPKNALGEVIEDTGDIKVCERCGTVVEKRDLDQWFFKITDYADRLLNGLNKIDWSPRVVIAQRNWIGKSEGMIIKFKIKKNKSKSKNDELEVFTTRPDTLNAATFLATSKLYKEGSSKEKIGKFSGLYALDPLSGRELPIWDTNYVAPDYGTGIIMGVPAHDERDMEFAKKYQIDIVEKNPDESLWEKIEKEGWGKKHVNYHLRDWLVSRQRYWGAPIPMIFCARCAAKDNTWLNTKHQAPNSKQIQNSKSQNLKNFGFRISDFGFPTQMAGWFPVPEEDLPVMLPEISDYQPQGEGRGPLANHKEFYEVKCPNCGGKAERETDVMDTFVDSSWYFLRYPSVTQGKRLKRVTGSAVKGKSLPWDPEITKKWLPVDLYFGGAEHSVLHLMYSRFVWMVLRDLGYLNFPAERTQSGGPAKMRYVSDWEEPFPKFFAHGLMIKNGAKMSKSRGNIVNPDTYIEKYGADTLRLYVMFMGPMDGSPDFRDSGIEGMAKFIKRIWVLFEKNAISKAQKAESGVSIKMHQTIKKVTEDIETFKYNTAIAGIMELVNVISEKGAAREVLNNLALLLAPFAPHLAEEIWCDVLGNEFSIHTHVWPKYDHNLVKEEEIALAIEVNGKVRTTIKISKDIVRSKKDIIDIVKNDENLTKWLKDKKIKKTIYVPGRVVNFVVEEG